MAFSDIFLSFFEMAAIVLLIVGFINEKKIAAFEAKLARAIKIYMRNRRIRKQRELARAYANVQSRAPAEVIEQAPVVEFRKPEFRNHYVA
jgi:hypothetical protein